MMAIRKLPRRGAVFVLLLGFFLYSIIVSNKCFSQGSISGSVVDKNGHALVNANVLLLKSKDSSVVKGSISSNGGLYSFKNITPGLYLLGSSFSGYKSYYSAVFSMSRFTDTVMPVIVLAESESRLDEVTVTAKKQLYEQKIDRLIINVGESITSAGSSALDVLMQASGVNFNAQSNTLSLNGKSDVLVMINGKISRMTLSSITQMLSGMNASNIERIELITTPPANFDAEGNAGFINIVMKTNTQYGTNGSYTALWGHGKRPVTSASINFNHRKGKFNFYGDYSYLKRRTRVVHVLDRIVNQRGDVVQSVIAGGKDVTIRNHNARLGLDYELGKNTILGLLVSGFHNRNFVANRLESRISSNSKLDTLIDIHYDEFEPLYNYGGNINMVHNFTKDEKVTVNLDYVFYKDRNPVNFSYSFQDGAGAHLFDSKINSNQITAVAFWVGGADYQKKVNDNFSFEAGLKLPFPVFQMM